MRDHYALAVGALVAACASPFTTGQFHPSFPVAPNNTGGVGNCSQKFPGQFGHDSTWCLQHEECGWCIKNETSGEVRACLVGDWQENCFCSMDPCSSANKGPAPPPALPAATVTDSGLKIKVMKQAPAGAMPKASDSVRVHYEGRLEDGTVFDSSIARGKPIVFPLSGVIAGWTEGLQLMHVGETALLTIPSDLAYGDGGQGPIPPKATLIFEVRLLAIA